MRRWLPGADSTADVVLGQQAYALVLALGLIASIGVLGVSIAPASLSVATVAAAVASGLLYYAAAYWFYLGALRNLPASRAVASFYLIPVVGVAGGVLWLGDHFDVRQWIGAVVVIAAVVLSSREPTDGEVEGRVTATIGQPSPDGR